MKIIHTADWHLGQNFFEYDRKEEHLRFLSWLKALIIEKDIDLLLIAGDIFDSPNPSADSQKTYYSFLHEMSVTKQNLQIIIIAGNHDSGGRIEAPRSLLEQMNINVRGYVKRKENSEIDYESLIIPIQKGGYCIAVPYLRQGDCPEAENYSQSVRKMYENIFEIVQAKAFKESTFNPIIAMGHLQAAGAELSDNDRTERTIIGGLEHVSFDSFPEEIAYTALGHLHKNQRVARNDSIRYSGTPIPMSFSEKNYTHGVVYIELESDYKKIQQIEFNDRVKLLSIPEKASCLNDVLSEIEKLPDGEITDFSPFLEVKIKLTEPEPSMRNIIENALKGKSVRLTRITAATTEAKESGETISFEELRVISPANLANKVFEQQYGEQMPEKMQKLLLEVISEVGYA
jgi:exonuclease SbcD